MAVAIASTLYKHQLKQTQQALIIRSTTRSPIYANTNSEDDFQICHCCDFSSWESCGFCMNGKMSRVRLILCAYECKINNLIKFI